MLFLKIFSIRNFQGFVVYCLTIKVLFVVLLSFFVVSGNFYRLPCLLLFVKNFFHFLFRHQFRYLPVPQATALIYYHITLALSITFFILLFQNEFIKVFADAILYFKATAYLDYHTILCLSTINSNLRQMS